MKREKTIWTAVGCAALGLALGLLFLFDPARGGFYPVCWFHELTGLNCPGCGSLRAVHHLLHGEVVVAFTCNPLLVISMLLVGGFLVSKAIKPRVRGQTQGRGKRHGLYWLILLVVVMFGVARNLPFTAFAWMSP